MSYKTLTTNAHDRVQSNSLIRTGLKRILQYSYQSETPSYLQRS